MTRKKIMCSSENVVSGVSIKLVKIEELHDFKEHPFKVERNQELFELRRSIEQEGILVPLLVRRNLYGKGFEVISGHRRKEAAIWAGIEEVPTLICEMDDDQSIIAMIDSNLQREKILPSEKGFAYKMRLQAMNRQGKRMNKTSAPLEPRKDETSDPLEPKFAEELAVFSGLEVKVSEQGKVTLQKTESPKGYRSNEVLAKMVGESVTQIKRYIRLTYLIPKLLDMVDRELLAIRSAVELSFLTEEEQYEVQAVMEMEQCIPNISQANRLKRMSQQKLLDMEKIYDILQEIKPNQKELIKIPLEKVSGYFPADYTPAQQVELIEKLLRSWAKNNEK